MRRTSVAVAAAVLLGGIVGSAPGASAVDENAACAEGRSVSERGQSVAAPVGTVHSIAPAESEVVGAQVESATVGYLEVDADSDTPELRAHANVAPADLNLELQVEPTADFPVYLCLEVAGNVVSTDAVTGGGVPSLPSPPSGVPAPPGGVPGVPPVPAPPGVPGLPV